MSQPRRLFVHVGLQKTGTSYLQSVLHDNAEALAERGLDLVPASKRDTFELMLLVRGRYNPDRDPASAAEALTRFGSDLAAAPGPTAILSQESLAAARPDQIDRLLSACSDREVHVVVTARDLARGLASSWQQELKSGRSPSYAEWLDRLRTAQQQGKGGHPWIHLDPAAVLERWSRVVPPERLHLVTVPPSGSSPTLLLERFCAVLGVDPAGLAPRHTAANTSLGRVQAELLRRVNGELSDDLRRRQIYGDVGKRWFSGRVLTDQRGRRIHVPEQAQAWCQEASHAQIAALRDGGYDVVGDLDELLPRDDAFAADDQPTDAEIAAVAVTALVRVLTLRSESVLERRARPGSGSAGLRRRLGSLLERGRSS